MKLLAHYMVFVVVLSISPALAAEPDAAAIPDKLSEKIVVSKAIDLLGALNAVTGNHDVIVGEGSSAHTTSVPYNLSADTLWVMTDDIKILRSFYETVQETVKKLAAQARAVHPDIDTPKKEAAYDANHNLVSAAVPSDALIELNKKIQELSDSERPIAKLGHIRRADLKPAMSSDAHVSGQVLATLLMIVDP